MGTDDLFHKKKARKAESHRREKAKRAPYERVLIVCEGIKTEPNYFIGLCREWGLRPATVIIEDKKIGLDPKGLVAFAMQTFSKNKDFENVFCVFDKDKHASYLAALDRIRSTRLKGTKFHAITSVPCFEVWILLHFTYTTHASRAAGQDPDCERVIDALDQKGCFPGYEKGSKEIFDVLRDKIDTAIKNAGLLEEFHKTSGTDNPSTKVHQLVLYLKSLRR